MPKRPESDRYNDLMAGAKPGKGEAAAVLPYLEADEALIFRRSAERVGETDGRVVFDGGVVVVVTDRKVVFARTSGGFRPQWEVFTLPYGHLEPGIEATGTEVLLPTSGRRSYRIGLAEPGSAGQLAERLGGAFRVYRRDRMGLGDA